MHTVLLLFYSLICGFAIVKMPFVRNSGIRPVVLLFLFAVHVLTGLAHNVIAYRYYPGHGDIWDNFWKSFMYRHRLVSDFALFRSDNSTWTYISHNGLIYIQLILNFLSFDHLDINTLLFSFPVFLGNIALFRVFRQRFPDDPVTAGAVFLLPSVLFWTSCIHREGMLYMLLGFLLFTLQRMMTNGYTTGRTIGALLCLLLIFYFRAGFALTLLPATYIGLFLEKPRARPFLLIAGAVGAIALLLILVLPGFHIPEAMAAWQKEFYGLEGHSRLPLPALDGSWASLARILPAATLNGLFEPLPGVGGQPIYLAFSLELLLIWLLVLLALLKHPPLTPFSISCLVFSLTGMLFIGLFVPFAGALVRYRSIYLLFLLAPCLHSLSTTRPFRELNHWLSRRAFYRL
jgi:hypothetical protein